MTENSQIRARYARITSGSYYSLCTYVFHRKLYEFAKSHVYHDRFMYEKAVQRKFYSLAFVRE